MAKKSTRKAAIEAINEKGCLLVYPIVNKKEPASVWSQLYPRSKMTWDWNADADGRISDLWILREELSRSKEVVYAKWYQNRATFFSREIFTNMLSYLKTPTEKLENLHLSSREALDSLLIDSPQSTKILKEHLGWQGKLMESHYNRAMKPLWNSLLIVGYGEVEDSSFPSLNMAATQHLYEDLWLESETIAPEKAEKVLIETLGEDSLFMKQARKLSK